MKKLIVAVITLFIGTTVFSQEIDLGVKAGVIKQVFRPGFLQE